MMASKRPNLSMWKNRYRSKYLIIVFIATLGHLYFSALCAKYVLIDCPDIFSALPPWFILPTFVQSICPGRHMLSLKSVSGENYVNIMKETLAQKFTCAGLTDYFQFICKSKPSGSETTRGCLRRQ